MSAAIIQCDDFGITPSVSNGIVRALGAHAATSTSVMANLVADAELGALRTVASRTGVHLNLTLGRPLTPAASLAPLLDAAGEFSGLRVIFKALLTARLPLAAIRCEWQAQIERVRDAGLTVIALDGHQHVHWFGPLAEVAAELAQEFAVERIRAPRHVIGNRLELRTLARALLARAAAAPLVQHGARSPATLLDLEVIEEREQPLSHLSRLLRRVRGDLEVCAHPSAGAVADARTYGSYDRARQLEWLLSGQLNRALTEAGFSITPAAG